jgi:hypothetical protein
MPLHDEEFVRLRAYALWIEEGQPEGRESEHWERARREMELTSSRAERPLDGHMSPQQAGEDAKERHAPGNK